MANIYLALQDDFITSLDLTTVLLLALFFGSDLSRLVKAFFGYDFKSFWTTLNSTNYMTLANVTICIVSCMLTLLY